MPTEQRETQTKEWGTTELQHFEKRLMEERKRAVAQMAQFDDELGMSDEESTGEITTFRFHMADLGTETFEREQNFLLALLREGRLLGISTRGSVPALPSHKFGRCDECGKQIAYERLDAIPYVPRWRELQAGLGIERTRWQWRTPRRQRTNRPVVSLESRCPLLNRSERRIVSRSGSASSSSRSRSATVCRRGAPARARRAPRDSA